jgi:hypothetical protein
MITNKIKTLKLVYLILNTFNLKIKYYYRNQDKKRNKT